MWSGARWIRNSFPAGRGDEKADSWQPRVPEPSCSDCPPHPGWGHAWLPVGLRQFGFIYLLEGEGRMKSLLAPPTPCSKL